MPRDLQALAERGSLLSSRTSAGPEDSGTSAEQDATNAAREQIALFQSAQKEEKRNELHPYVRTLTLADVDHCVELENATFSEDQRATRQKFQYRFSTCGELSLGLFTKQNADPPPGPEAAREILLAHCVATKLDDNVVTDEAMAIPPGWELGSPVNRSPLGHQEAGRSLGIHSLAVLPEYQHRGLGKTLMKAYIQRMSQAHIADRIALICHDYLITFYEKLGFRKLGESKAQFGGGGWYDMVLEFSKVDADAIEALLVTMGLHGPNTTWERLGSEKDGPCRYLILSCPDPRDTHPA